MRILRTGIFFCITIGKIHCFTEFTPHEINTPIMQLTADAIEVWMLLDLAEAIAQEDKIEVLPQLLETVIKLSFDIELLAQEKYIIEEQERLGIVAFLERLSNDFAERITNHAKSNIPETATCIKILLQRSLHQIMTVRTI